MPLPLGLGFYELTLHFIHPWGLRWDLQGDTRGWEEQGRKGLSLESGEEAPPLLPHLWKSPLGRLPLKLPIARVHRQTSSQGNTQTPQAQGLTGTGAPASPGHSGAGLTARLTQTHAVDPGNHTLRGTHARTQTLGAPETAPQGTPHTHWTHSCTHQQRHTRTQDRHKEDRKHTDTIRNTQRGSTFTHTTNTHPGKTSPPANAES